MHIHMYICICIYAYARTSRTRSPPMPELPGGPRAERSCSAADGKSDASVTTIAPLATAGRDPAAVPAAVPAADWSLICLQRTAACAAMWQRVSERSKPGGALHGCQPNAPATKPCDPPEIPEGGSGVGGRSIIRVAVRG